MAGENLNVTYVKVYTNDSLEKIARRHFTTVEKILELNPEIKDANLIEKGDTLRIPTTVFENSNKEEQALVGDTLEFSHKNVANDTTIVANSALSDSLNVVNKNDSVKSDSTYIDSTKVALSNDSNMTSKENEPEVVTSNIKEQSEKTSFWDTTAGTVTKTVLAFGLGFLAFKIGKSAIKYVKNGMAKTSSVTKNATAVGQEISQLKPTAEASKKVAEIEKIMSQPTDYAKVANSYVSEAPSKAIHDALQKEYDKMAVMRPTRESNAAVRDTLKQLRGKNNIDYKELIESRIPLKPTASQHNKAQAMYEDLFRGEIQSPESKKIVEAIEKQLSQPTDYAKVANSYVSEAPSKAMHDALQKEYDKMAIRSKSTPKRKKTRAKKEHRYNVHNDGKPKNLKELMAQRKKEKIEKSAKYIIGKDAKSAEKSAELKQKLEHQEYLASIGLGSAKPTKSSGMTWSKYAQEHGTNYQAPKSGVAEVDRIAAEIIQKNRQREFVPFSYVSSTRPNLDFKYVNS